MASMIENLISESKKYPHDPDDLSGYLGGKKFGVSRRDNMFIDKALSSKAKRIFLPAR